MARGGTASPKQTPTDWVTRAADDAIRHAGDGHRPVDHRARRAPPRRARSTWATCASSSPSHFVADELRRRGVPVRHLHVWDDYDRFRKVPAGVDPSWAEHIGRPLSAVPDPWECHASWAEHFKAPLRDALARAWASRWRRSPRPSATAPAPTATQVLHAVAPPRRHRGGAGAATAPRSRARPRRDRAGGRGAGGLRRRRRRRREPTGAGDLARFPLKPYCRDCGRDTTTVTAYDDETTDLAYTCSVVRLPRHHQPRHRRTRASWSGRSTGRCAGPSSTSTSSRPAWTTRRPGRRSPSATSWSRRSSGLPRAGAGSATASSASPACRRCRRRAGGAPTAEDALRVLEAPILRWLYVRRQPKQTFDIDFGARGRAAVRRVGRAGPQGRRPGEARRPGARLRARRRRPRPPARCRRPRSSCRSGCSRRSPT